MERRTEMESNVRWFMNFMGMGDMQKFHDEKFDQWWIVQFWVRVSQDQIDYFQTEKVIPLPQKDGRVVTQTAKHFMKYPNDWKTLCGLGVPEQGYPELYVQAERMTYEVHAATSIPSGCWNLTSKEELNRFCQEHGLNVFETSRNLGNLGGICVDCVEAWNAMYGERTVRRTTKIYGPGEGPKEDEDGKEED